MAVVCRCRRCGGLYQYEIGVPPCCPTCVVERRAAGWCKTCDFRRAVEGQERCAPCAAAEARRLRSLRTIKGNETRARRSQEVR